MPEAAIRPPGSRKVGPPCLALMLYEPMVSEVAGPSLAHASLGHPGAATLGRASARPASLQPLLKRGLDILGAGLLLLLAAPAFALLALLIRADGGPVFYAHERVGRGGRRFGCLKFRSMVTDSQARLAALLEADPAARAEWEATRKLRDDPRVTRTGRFLRATSLDELPQLINVLRGEMSLVGPRPVVAAELAAHYGAAAEYYLSVRPGITGLWQISGRSETSYDTRVALDTRYATNMSVWTDLRILLRTPLVVLSRRGAY
ncbi:sugar transferase [Dankookia sp. P2]|uniref:sugar transferase n=1 Tax=Dankookia sp. P2 TaxID=3423955 RepID=UPI003D6737C8